MNYVVIDLEWNQYHNPLRTPTSRSGVKMHEEIIQIGAIKTDHAMNPIDTFSLYVRLSGGRRLDKYVKKLTHISDYDIACGEDFSVASAEFAQWLEDVDAIFSWGPDDRRVFLNNLAFYDLPAPACAWYDAQKIFADQVPEHGGLALKTVAEAMNVRVSLTLHDAMNDAILTAFCMAKLDIESGVKNYAHPKTVKAAAGDQPQPISTAKTHRHTSQQAAWEEACNGLMRCPACMQNLEWCGEEKGTITRWYKSARCEKHGEYIVRGEFNGQKMYTLKFSFFPNTPEVLEMVKRETEPAAPTKKRRHRRRKKANAELSAEALAPEEMLSRAIAFAAEAHKAQTRKGGTIPYIVHPMETVSIVATMTDDAALLAAAVLHDTVEDCENVTQEAIEQKFGAHVADLVAFESENKTDATAENWHERKQETLDRLKTADEEQMMLVLGDKLSNARALHRDYMSIKNDVWKRFHQTDKREQAWYYRSLVEALQPLNRFEAYGEFEKLVNAVFGRLRSRKKQTN